MFRVVALFLVTVSVNAFASPPSSPLPVPESLPPCELGLPEQAKAVFPCGVLVHSENGLNTGQIAQLLQSSGAEVKTSFRLVSGASGVIPDNIVLQALLNQPGVSVVPNRRVYALKKPANPGNGGGGSSSSQVVPDGVKRIGAAPGMLSVDGSGVGVAVVDTGVDKLNADLHVAAVCFDAYNGDCSDGHGHGTHVSGIIGANDNNIDVVGVAPGATIYAVKVLDDTGSGSDDSIISGLQWVAEVGAGAAPPVEVVNMSLGREGSLNDSPLLRQAVQAVDALGITVVVAAGNDPTLEVKDNVPATYPEVLAVASTTAKNGSTKCRSSNYIVPVDTASFFTTDGALDGNNIGVTISAPGAQSENINRSCMSLSSNGILSLQPGGGTTRMSGTSMAAPHVAGVVALLAQKVGIDMVNSTYARGEIRASASRSGVAPLDSPTTKYTFDGEREGVISGCGVVGECP